MRLQETVVHLARHAHTIRAQQQIAQRYALKGAEIRRILDGRLLEAIQRFLESFARAPGPEVPALFDQIVGMRNIQPVTKLWPVADPQAEFPERLLHFADGD